MRHVLGQDAGIVRAHGPGVVAMIIIAQEKDFALAGVCAREHHAKGGGVRAVFHEKGPVRHGYGIHQRFRAFHHLIGRRGGAIGDAQLLYGGFVHIRVAIAQHVRAVGAHAIQIAVAVHIPEIGSLGARGDQRPVFQRQKQPL